MDALWTAQHLKALDQFERHRSFSSLWVHQMKTPIAAIHLLLKMVRR